MARFTHEILNPELFGLRAGDSVANAILGILSLRITAAPVLAADKRPQGVVSLRDLVGAPHDGVVGDWMTRPAWTVSRDATIEEAGQRMAEHDVHHLVAVDGEGHAVGIVSSLDVVRALLGIPITHPAAFPHTDVAGLVWSDPASFDIDGTSAAPDGPGLFVLIRGEAGVPELPMWAEAANNVRTRLHELLSVPQTDNPQLARLLGREQSELRFRAASVPDAGTRAESLLRVRADVAAASGLPSPKRAEATK
jgi:hypothetical protein